MTTMPAIFTDNFADWEFGPVAAAARGFCGPELEYCAGMFGMEFEGRQERHSA